MATPVTSKAGSAIMAFVVADGIATVDLLSSDEGKWEGRYAMGYLLSKDQKKLTPRQAFRNRSR